MATAEQDGQIEGGARSPAAVLARLRRMGIQRWSQVLLCLPKSFVDYSRFATLDEAMPMPDRPAEPRLFSLAVTEVAVMVSQPKKRLLLTATDGMHQVKICVFVVPGVDVVYWRALGVGERIHVYGTLHVWNGRIELTDPLVVDPAQVGTVRPAYEKRRGVVADGAIYDASRQALRNHMGETVRDLIASYRGLSEQDILHRARLRAADIATVLLAAHAPKSAAQAIAGIAGMKRLAALSVVENARHLRYRDPEPDSIVDIPPSMVSELVTALPHALTDDQRMAIEEIRTDLASALPMRRVLSGDVGCGKTYCLMIPALAAQRLGKRVAILTPNALLAEQFVKECRAAFGRYAPVQIVTGNSKKRIVTYGNPILVGTTALLARLRPDQTPDILMVDEQHRFGVAQKMELAKVGTNYLEATATPIPRTTALVTHGAMDVSIIRQMPVEKQIVSRIVRASDAKRLFEHTKRVLAAGDKVMVVYPTVANAEQEKKSVVAAFETWNQRFPGKVVMVHGQMKEAEKIKALDSLKSGHRRLGIVSTVIELGVTVPSLKSLVIVNAERFGTATLHQLRGRVARHGGTGYFFMYLPDPVRKEAMTRLRLVEQHSDGFILAEKDAELRGYGDLFEDAERQSGASRSNVFYGAALHPADIHLVSRA